VVAPASGEPDVRHQGVAFDAGADHSDYKQYYTNAMAPLDIGALQAPAAGQARWAARAWRRMEDTAPEGVAETLGRAGARVSDSARPPIDVDASLETYHALLWGVMGAGAPDELHEGRKQRAAELGDDDQSPGAREIRYAVQDHRAWLRHHHQRYRLREAWSRFFDDWDILICPQMSTAAFPHDHGEAMGVLADPFDLLGPVPAMSQDLGREREGHGRHHQDDGERGDELEPCL